MGVIATYMLCTQDTWSCFEMNKFFHLVFYVYVYQQDMKVQRFNQ